MGSFARNALTTTISQAASVAVGLGTAVILARALGPDGRGTYAVVCLVSSTLCYFFTLGLGQASVYHIGRGVYPHALVYGHAVAFALLLSAAAVAVGAVLIQTGSSTLFPGVEPGLLFAGLAVVPVSLAFGFFSYVALGSQRFWIYNLANLLRACAFFVAVALSSLLFPGNIVALIVADAASYALGTALVGALLWKEAVRPSFSFSASYTMDCLRYGLPIWAGTALLFLHYRADIFLLNLMSSTAAVGVYTLSASLAEKLSLLSDGVATALFPRVSAERDGKTLRDLTPAVLRAVLLVVAAAAGVLFVVAPWVIPWLFSELFAAAAGPFRILLLGTVALSGWSILEGDLKGRGKPVLPAIGTMLSVVVNVALNLYWIPRYGASGAALASTVSYLSVFALGLGVYARASGNSFADILAPRRSDVAHAGLAVAALRARLRSPRR